MDKDSKLKMRGTEKPATDSIGAVSIPKNFIGNYGDPKMWAHSTLETADISDLVKIWTITQKNAGAGSIRQRIWLHDVLDDEEIPYVVHIEGKWITRKKFAESQLILVEQKNQTAANALIKQYNNPGELVRDDTNIEITADEADDGMPLKKCPSCERAIDFDYHTCPHCKAKQP